MMKNIGLLTAIVVAGTVAGCTSTQGVLSKGVSETWKSSQSAREVAFCLANKNNVSALERDDGSRVVLIKNGYGGVAIALSVFPEGTGSRTEVRHEFGIIGAVWKQCLGSKVSSAYFPTLG